MNARRIFSIVGSIGLTLVFVTLVMTLPVIAAMPDSNRSPGSTLLSQALGSAGPVLNGTTTSSTLSCREGLAGWEPYLSTGIDIQALGGGLYLDFDRHAPAPQPNAMEYVQVLQVKQNKDAQGNYLPSYTLNPPLSDAG